MTRLALTRGVAGLGRRGALRVLLLSRPVRRAFACVLVRGQDVVNPERGVLLVVLRVALNGDADGKQRRRDDEEQGDEDPNGLGTHALLPSTSSIMGCAAAGPASTSSTESPTRRTATRPRRASGARPPSRLPWEAGQPRTARSAPYMEVRSRGQGGQHAEGQAAGNHACDRSVRRSRGGGVGQLNGDAAESPEEGVRGFGRRPSRLRQG